MNASSNQAARLRWASIGADTWRVGKWTVYRSSLPEPVYWVSKGNGRPERIESRAAVLEKVGANAND